MADLLLAQISDTHAVNPSDDVADSIVDNNTRLAATVVVIGIIGFYLDYICLKAVQRLNWVRES